MKTIIRHINSINKIKLPFTNKPDYMFYGDGQGDFEKSGDDATVEVLVNYIVNCKEQIKIAEEILERKLT